MVNENFLKVMSVLTAGYPMFELRPETVRLYCEMLSDLDSKLLVEAAKNHLAHGKFFPSVAELREEAKVLLCRKNKIPTAEEAWEEVQQQIHSEGNYGRPMFSHDMVRRTMIACGGWNHLCVDANMDVVRAQYMRIYESYIKRAREDELMLPSTKTYLETGSKTAITQQLIGVVVEKLKTAEVKS